MLCTNMPPQANTGGPTYDAATRKNASFASAGHSGRVGAAVGAIVGETVVGASVGGAVDVAQIVNPPKVPCDCG